MSFRRRDPFLLSDDDLAKRLETVRALKAAVGGRVRTDADLEDFESVNRDAGERAARSRRGAYGHRPNGRAR